MNGNGRCCRFESRDDEEGQEGVGEEGDDGVDEEGECANSRSLFPELFEFRFREVRFEKRVDVKLPYVCRDIVEEGKPANPVRELDFANFADARRKAPCCGEDLFEEGYNAWVVGCGRAVETRISLLDEQAAYAQGRAQSKARNNTQHFELSVAKEWEMFRQVDVTKNISKDVSNPCNAGCPGIGVLLLVRRGAIDYKGSYASLD